MKKKYYTQTEIDYYIEKLYNLIKNSGKKFDQVVGIERGGVHISKPLSEKLNLSHKTIKISHYNDEIRRKEPIVDFDSFEREGRKYTLFCDDLKDSGATIRTLAEHGLFAENDAIAVLFVKDNNLEKPEFYVEEVSSEIWCVFPWEQNG